MTGNSLRFGFAATRGIITSAYMNLSAQRGITPQYGYSLLHTYDLLKVFYGLGSGLRQNLDWSDFKYLPCLVPPPPEQSAIIRFVDYMDRRMRKYIRAKQKLIKLLEEQKQAIINRAVTRGLDPNVKLKPSGVPWLGDVPVHWGIIPARHLFRAVTRRDTRDDDVKLSVTQKHGLVPTAEMEENSTQAISYDRFQVCHPGDLVLNKYKAHLGVFWAAERRGLITPNYTVFRPAQALVTKYFQLLFHMPAYRDAFSMMVYGVTEGMSPLYTQDFYRIATLRPSFAEQGEIVRHVVSLTMAQDAVVERVGREIAVLREYRTRLVADVVTGKLDVREVAANLPKEVEEPASPVDEELEEDVEDADGTNTEAAD